MRRHSSPRNHHASAPPLPPSRAWRPLVHNPLLLALPDHWGASTALCFLLPFGTEGRGWQLGMRPSRSPPPSEKGLGFRPWCLSPTGSGWTGRTGAHRPEWTQMATSSSTWPSLRRPTATLSSSTSPGTRATAPSASTLLATLVLTGQELGGVGRGSRCPLANV